MALRSGINSNRSRADEPLDKIKLRKDKTQP
jgi:hypothetical protein